MGADVPWARRPREPVWEQSDAVNPSNDGRIPMRGAMRGTNGCMGAGERRSGRPGLPWLLAVVAWAVSLACSDETPDIFRPDDLPRMAVVSDPAQVSFPALAGAWSLAPSATDQASDPVYVSLPPGSFPGSSSVDVRNRATGDTEVIPMVEGGFDPVRVGGSVGDTLDFVALSGSSSIAEWFEVVEAMAPPTIVRTYPSRGKRDVPLRPTIDIVFSEPMDPRTLDRTTVRLMRGDVVLSWQVAVTSDLLKVTLTPDQELTPSTEYALSIGGGLRDLDGDALESGLEVRFSTTSQADRQLAFLTQPVDVTAGDTIEPAVQVAVQDLLGRTITTASDTVVLDNLADDEWWRAGEAIWREAAVGGVATFSDVHFRIAAAYRLVARAPGFAEVASAVFEVAPGPATTLYAGGPAHDQAGVNRPFTLSVFAGDVFGNAVGAGSYVVTVGLEPSSSAGTLSGTLTQQITDGEPASFELTIDQPGTYALTMSAPGLSDGSTELDISGPVAALQLDPRWVSVPPLPKPLAGYRFPLDLSVRPVDASGHYAFEYFEQITVSIGVNPSGGVLTGRTTVSTRWYEEASGEAYTGDAIFRDLRIDRPGQGYTLVVSNGSLSAETTPFDVYPATDVIAYDRAGAMGLVSAVNGGAGHVDLAGGEAWVPFPSWSPDGTAIVFGQGDIYTASLLGTSLTSPTQLTAGGGVDSEPAWSPDGSRIAFVRYANSVTELLTMSPNGSGITRLTAVAGWAGDPTWSPDGTRIAFEYAGDIYVIGADGAGLSRLTSGLPDDRDPAWSPDGARIAFSSDRNGPPDLYTMVPDGSDVVQLTTVGPGKGAFAPAWSSGGAWIAFTLTDPWPDPDPRYVHVPWSFGDIHVIHADGSGLTWLGVDGRAPAWRPGP